MVDILAINRVDFPSLHAMLLSRGLDHRHMLRQLTPRGSQWVDFPQRLRRSCQKMQQHPQHCGSK